MLYNICFCTFGDLCNNCTTGTIYGIKMLDTHLNIHKTILLFFFLITSICFVIVWTISITKAEYLEASIYLFFIFVLLILGKNIAGKWFLQIMFYTNDLPCSPTLSSSGEGGDLLPLLLTQAICLTNKTPMRPIGTTQAYMQMHFVTFT